MASRPTKRNKPLKRFKVRYGRVVLMETVVEAESADEVRDEGLPGVFDGIPTELIGRHVDDVQDCEQVWEVTEAERPAEGGQAVPPDGLNAKAERKAMESVRDSIIGLLERDDVAQEALAAVDAVLGSRGPEGWAEDARMGAVAKAMGHFIAVVKSRAARRND